MADFNFTQISDSNGLYPRYGNPSINDAGTLTFEGFPGFCNAIGGDCLQTGTNAPPAAILTGNGNGPNTTIINRSIYPGFSGYDSGVFFSASTNNSGTTVLAASGFNYGQLAASGPSAVITVNDGQINNAAYSSDPFRITLVNFNGPFDNSNLAATGNFASAPGINNAGTVAYVAGQNDGQNQTTTLFTQTSDGDITPIADTSGFLSNFYLGGLNVQRGQGPFASYTLPSINDEGTVAFNAGLDTGGSAIFTGSGGQLTTIADTNSGFTYLSAPTLNDSETVAFNGGFAGGSGVFTSSNGQITTIAETSGIFSDFRSDVALNELGQVTFLADLDNGRTAIFTGSDSGLNEVIAVGDSLGGSTVTQLFISHDGLNDAGQVAFDAVLADGSQRVFRADPIAVPESNGSALFALAILGIVGLRWGRQKRARG